MADQLVPMECAFKVGDNMDYSDAANVIVNIISSSNGGTGGHLDNAKFKIEFGINAVDYASYDKNGVPNGYIVEINELGFPTTDIHDANTVSIVDHRVKPEVMVTTSSNLTYLNLKIPVNFTKKKESGSVAFKKESE